MTEQDLPVEGEWNHKIQAHVVRVTDHWVVGVIPMIFNDRVILMDKRDWDSFITAGFCYDKGGAAHLAAAVWDPETEREPVGYKKVSHDLRQGAMR